MLYDDDDDDDNMGEDGKIISLAKESNNAGSLLHSYRSHSCDGRQAMMD